MYQDMLGLAADVVGQCDLGHLGADTFEALEHSGRAARCGGGVPRPQQRGALSRDSTAMGASWHLIPHSPIHGQKMAWARGKNGGWYAPRDSNPEPSD